LESSTKEELQLMTPNVNNDENTLNILEYNPNEETVWIFDAGASEHITCNKDILKEWKKKKVTFRCANNTTCEFEGNGTYEGSLNGHEFKLKKVLYTSKINKNLICGIELIKEGLICKIKPRKNHKCLALKYNNKKQKDKFFG